MASLRRSAGPSTALALLPVLLFVAPTAGRPMDQTPVSLSANGMPLGGRSLSQLNVTTTNIPFLTNLKLEDLEGEWIGEFQTILATRAGGTSDEEICLSEGCRNAFPAASTNMSISEGGRTLTSVGTVPGGLPSPPEACQEEGLAEEGRSEQVYMLSGNVSSYTPSGNMGLTVDLSTTTGGSEDSIERGFANWCIKFRVWVTDAGAVKAEWRTKTHFQGTSAKFLEDIRSGEFGPRCFIPNVDPDLTTCQILLQNPQNFVRTVVQVAETTCSSGKCLGIATKG